MMKHFMNNLFIGAIILFSTLTYAKTGLLFNVAESGAPASIDLLLCLNGKGALSCQNYHASAQDLQISTTIARHYPAAGIKVLTPGYQATGCTPSSNGYCLFAVSSQASTAIRLGGNRPSHNTVGGTISGLAGSISLQNNGGDTLTQNSDGSFTFATAIAEGSAHHVTVSSQPTMQSCTVSNGTGTMGGSNITNIQVTCSTNGYTVGGTITGLVGSVSLQNNSGDTLTKNSDGSFAFATGVAEGGAYNVTISSQPATQTCMVSDGTGTMGSSNISDVQVTCSTNSYTLGGTITGLVGSVTLQNNGSDMLTRNSDGSFTFATAVTHGSAYHVAVSSQPATHTCIVSNGTGSMGGSNIADVQVTCSINSYTVGGTITGLVGSVSLQNNSGDILTQNSDGSFTFATAVAEGGTYNVSVSSQPATQTCTVSNGMGTMGGSNINDVQVTCSINSYTLGGTITGLVGSVSLQNNGSDMLTQNSDGSFTFVTAVAQGSAYNVAVSSQPATHTCIVNNGTGSMGGSNIADVQVTCSINSYTVGGTITGLVGSVSLQNNSGDILTQNSDGSFTFATAVAQGSAYNVTVSSQPATQTCTVSNGMGTMGGSNINDVQVTCAINSYTLGGTITGLVGSVSLQNNSGDTLTQNSDGSFTFATAVAQGSAYHVAVSSQPATHTCIVSNGAGIMGGSNIADVQVTCSINSYTVGGTITGLVGSVSLQNNSGDTLTHNSDGSFTFAAAVAHGGAYNVTVSSQPATQTCIVNNSTGTMGGSNINDVQVTCSINSYTLGGTITGLVGSVSLQNNSGDTLTHNSDGSFTFVTAVAHGGAYNVTVSSQPATQTCTVSNGMGTMGGSNISDVQVTCSINSYTLGGTITGLVGSVSLQNNGSDTLTQNSDGSFTFAAAVAQGGAYSVTLSSQPAAQTCTVSNGTGIMGGSNISDVQVTCSTNSYTLGGTITGLVGSVSLRNNGGDTLVRNSDGSFTFATAVAHGSGYNVTVSSQPAAQTCTVNDGAGTMGSSNITNVDVSCVTNTTTLFVFSGTIPVGSGSTSILVINTGSTYPAINVSIALPSGWTGVTQDASNCTSIAPNNGSCNIILTSVSPYVAQGNISVIGANISNAPVITLSFSVQGYLVWEVTDATTVQVADSADLPKLRWGNSVLTNAQDSRNGVGNTSLIKDTSGVGSTAAMSCYNSTNGGASIGSWYLPAVCQLGSSGKAYGCPPGLANMDTNLSQLGLASLGGDYWSSTEDSGNAQNNAWYMYLNKGGGHQSSFGKSADFYVRCARALTY